MEPHSYTLTRQREESLQRARQRVTADHLFAEQVRAAALRIPSPRSDCEVGHKV